MPSWSWSNSARFFAGEEDGAGVEAGAQRVHAADGLACGRFGAGATEAVAGGWWLVAGTALPLGRFGAGGTVGILLCRHIVTRFCRNEVVGADSGDSRGEIRYPVSR